MKFKKILISFILCIAMIPNVFILAEEEQKSINTIIEKTEIHLIDINGTPTLVNYKYHDDTEHEILNIYAQYRTISNGRSGSTSTSDSYFSSAVDLTGTITYTKYSSSNVIDGGTYYRIKTLTYTFTYLETPCTINKVKLTIYNNGISEGLGVTNQSTTGTFYSSSGTLSGNTNWTPTAIGTGSQTGGLIEFTIKRGTGYYSSSMSLIPN